MEQGMFSLQQHIEIAGAMGLSVCVLDSGLKCVYGEGVINKGDRLTDILHQRIELPIRGCGVGCITANDHFYCVRIFPIVQSPFPEYYLCEVMDSSTVAQLADNTDISARAASVISAVKYRADKAQELCGVLCENTSSYDMRGAAVELSTRLDRLRVTVDCLAAYGEVVYSCGRKVLFDAGRLCERLCRRLNTALADMGMAVAMPLYDESLYIFADGRHTFIAFLNMLHDSLLFSDGEAMPQPVLHCDDRTGCVVIRILNIPPDCAMSDESMIRLAVVKRYAEISGGSMEISAENRTLMLSLPAASAADIATSRLEEDIHGLFETEVERYIALLRTEREKIANVQ